MAKTDKLGTFSGGRLGFQCFTFVQLWMTRRRRITLISMLVIMMTSPSSSHDCQPRLKNHPSGQGCGAICNMHYAAADCRERQGGSFYPTLHSSHNSYWTHFHSAHFFALQFSLRPTPEAGRFFLSNTAFISAQSP